MAYRQERGFERREVGEEHPVPARDQHIFALHVAVADPFTMALSYRSKQEVHQPALFRVSEEWPSREAVAERAVKVLP